MDSILDQINAPNDIQKIAPENYDRLAEEIRQYLVKTVSKTGGHLASNLGAVELTIALHACLDPTVDRIIWDVGHQAYVHKILTGRKEELTTLRSFGGLSGFPKEEESVCDAFDTGHATTSIAVAAGYSRARDIKGENYNVVAVIGDGSFSGGMAFEALNNLSHRKTNTIIILNDNEMSISKNVGGLAAYLEKLRTSEGYIDFKGGVERTLNRTNIGSKVAKGLLKTKNSIRDLVTPGDLFKGMGMGYFGPINGHDIKSLMRAIKAAKTYRGAVVLHVITTKGKGYPLAEINPSRFHGIDPFYVKTGELRQPCNDPSYTSVFGDTIVELARENENIVAITAAMSSGTGLAKFKEEFPDRFFDVGIAEEYAVTFAAGLAAGGLRPVVAIYSTFLQRAYDQILHDVCLTGKKVVFAIDRAGIVGNDGKTHQGIYDIAYLSTIPGLLVVSPKDSIELKKALKFAFEYNGPVAVRYPRGKASAGTECEKVKAGKCELVRSGKKVAILSLGSMFENASMVCDMIKDDYGFTPTLYNARFSNPADPDMIRASAKYDLVVTMEEGVRSGGFGEHVQASLLELGYKGKTLNVSIPDIYLEHGSQDELRAMLGLDARTVYTRIKEVLDNEKET